MYYSLIISYIFILIYFILFLINWCYLFHYQLQGSRRRPVRAIFYISGDGLRVVEEETKVNNNNNTKMPLLLYGLDFLGFDSRSNY